MELRQSRIPGISGSPSHEKRHTENLTHSHRLLRSLSGLHRKGFYAEALMVAGVGGGTLHPMLNHHKPGAAVYPVFSAIPIVHTRLYQPLCPVELFSGTMMISASLAAME